MWTKVIKEPVVREEADVKTGDLGIRQGGGGGGGGWGMATSGEGHHLTLRSLTLRFTQISLVVWTR